MDQDIIQAGARARNGIFWGKVKAADEDACWLWQGSDRVVVKGEEWSPGRYAFTSYFGARLTDRQRVRRRCHNGACVNPAHLYTVVLRRPTPKGKSSNFKKRHQ